ncbi:hypothetical protein MBLNU457_4632t1 [Dothideomycetes sp. NU457]
MASSQSSIDPSIPPLKPTHPIAKELNEPPHLQTLINILNLQSHIEGGYFVETDRDPLLVPNPFLQPPTNPVQTFTSSSGSVSTAPSPPSNNGAPQHTTLDPMATGPSGAGKIEEDNSTRNASTTIHYMLTPSMQMGHFHRNKGRTIHTLHRGRGRYVLIHADEVMASYDDDSNLSSSSPSSSDQNEGGGKKEKLNPNTDERALKSRNAKARIETFIVGTDVEKGERVQWIVEGGKYKASFLLECEKDGRQEPLLISETVVPGFEFKDHDFLTVERFGKLVDEEQRGELEWLVRRE